MTKSCSLCSGHFFNRGICLRVLAEPAEDLDEEEEDEEEYPEEGEEEEEEENADKICLGEGSMPGMSVLPAMACLKRRARCGPIVVAFVVCRRSVGLPGRPCNSSSSCRKFFCAHVVHFLTPFQLRTYAATASVKLSFVPNAL